MRNVTPKAIAIQHIIDDIMRSERGRLLASLISRLKDFQLAEDALQEASISALKHWSRSGIPKSPFAWLLKVGLNKGIDRIRAMQRENTKLEAISILSLGHIEIDEDKEAICDERLRLIFTCCHPAIEEKSRVALTLRTVCNLTTREIAAAFLDTEQAMGQRLSRSKAKIKSKGIGFSIPESEQWAERLSTVLSTLYLIFTTGYVNEDKSSRDLCREGIFLARLLRKLKPNEPEIEGALALMLLTEARKPARIDINGAIVPIEDQNNFLWHEKYILEAQTILENAIKQRKLGSFQIKATIVDCHMQQPKPDWQQMSLLYQSLWSFEPTPIIALNWSVVIAEIGHIQLALKKINSLQDELKDFQPWYAAQANILEKLGRQAEAYSAYKQAILRAPNNASRNFLENRLQKLIVN